MAKPTPGDWYLAHDHDDLPFEVCGETIPILADCPETNTPILLAEVHPVGDGESAHDDPEAIANAKLMAGATRLARACETMLDAYKLIPVPDCMTEQECEEYRGLDAARKNLIGALRSVGLQPAVEQSPPC